VPVIRGSFQPQNQIFTIMASMTPPRKLQNHRLDLPRRCELRG
jgi:hypothetical protein